MSTEVGDVSTSAAANTTSGFRSLELRNAQVLRFAFGVTVSTAIAFGLAWPLHFLTPVLATFFLSLPLPAPTPGQALKFLGYVLGSTSLGLVFTLFLLPYPLVYVPALGLILFHIYYLANRGASPFLVILCLLAVLILPMMSIHHDLLAILFGLNFAGSATLALAFYLIAHAVIPDPVLDRPLPRGTGLQPGYSSTAALNALKSTGAILPIASVFITLELTGEILVMVFAAMVSMAPDVSVGKASGITSLKATLIGGAAAIAFYWLIVAVPEFPFFVALMLLTMLLFGSGIFSNHPLSSYLASAAIALLILVGGSLGENADFTEKLFMRVLMISAATLYVMAVLTLIQVFFDRLRTAPH